jgi:hypothetical protein
MECVVAFSLFDSVADFDSMKNNGINDGLGNPLLFFFPRFEHLFIRSRICPCLASYPYLLAYIYPDLLNRVYIGTVWGPNNPDETSNIEKLFHTLRTVWRGVVHS